jgi:hypothetical protein
MSAPDDAGARRRREKNARKAEKARRAAASLDAEVDRILARVSEVGMQGLTRKERDTLREASRRPRGD